MTKMKERGIRGAIEAGLLVWRNLRDARTGVVHRAVGAWLPACGEAALIRDLTPTDEPVSCRHWACQS